MVDPIEGRPGMRLAFSKDRGYLTTGLSLVVGACLSFGRSGRIPGPAFYATALGGSPKCRRSTAFVALLITQQPFHRVHGSWPRSRRRFRPRPRRFFYSKAGPAAGTRRYSIFAADGRGSSEFPFWERARRR